MELIISALLFITNIFGGVSNDSAFAAKATDNNQSASVELGLLETSPNGFLGGLAVPASGCSAVNPGEDIHGTVDPTCNRQCSDGVDNDGDALVDANDPGCWTDPTDPGTYDPWDDDETNAVAVAGSVDLRSFHINYSTNKITNPSQISPRTISRTQEVGIGWRGTNLNEASCVVTGAGASHAAGTIRIPTGGSFISVATMEAALSVNDFDVTTNGGLHRADLNLIEPAPGTFSSYTISCLDTSGNIVGDSITIYRESECDDGIDNDGDGFIDFVGNDPGCDDPYDDDETDAGPLAFTVDLKVNGSDGPVSITSGSNISVEWEITGNQPSTCVASSDDPGSSWQSSGGTSNKTTTVGQHNESVLNVTQDTEYFITCTLPGTTPQLDSVQVLTSPVPPPVVGSVNLGAASLSVMSGSPANLNWTSSNIQPGTCQANSAPNGVWSGAKANNSASDLTGPLSVDTDFWLNCTDTNGNSVQSNIVTVSALPQPSLNLSASTPVNSGNPTTLTWNPQNVSNCVASSNPFGHWSGGKVAGNSPDLSTPLTVNPTTFTLTCDDLLGNPYFETVLVNVNIPSIPPTISVSTPIVRKGNPVNVSWNPGSYLDCVLSGNLTSDPYATNNEDHYPTAQTTYAITCGGGSDSASVSVIVLPSLQET